MAFFRTIAKISGSSLLNINRHVKYSPRTPILFKQNRNMFKQNMRTYWSGKSKIFIPRFNKDYEYKYLSGNCGKQPLSRVEPYKEKFSKCLEIYNKPVKKSRRHLSKFKKPPPVIKEKPTNCHKMEPRKIKSSFSKNIKNESKKTCSLSCNCLKAYQKQMMLGQKDPCLSNPCYESTPGDVLIYTQIINTKKLECPEPEPRSTPPYKVPRAALCKRIIENTEKTLCQNITSLPQHDNCTRRIFTIHSIPFQEMRPPDKKKKAFTCRDGVSTEDVIYPSNTANNFCIMSIVKKKING